MTVRASDRVRARKNMITRLSVDYRQRVSMPVRDMHNDGAIVFYVDVYGVEPNDLCLIPGGSAPMRKAVERLGLDPYRYQAVLWDVPI